MSERIFQSTRIEAFSFCGPKKGGESRSQVQINVDGWVQLERDQVRELILSLAKWYAETDTGPLHQMGETGKCLGYETMQMFNAMVSTIEKPLPVPVVEKKKDEKHG
jgi:hypothetical protein